MKNKKSIFTLLNEFFYQFGPCPVMITNISSQVSKESRLSFLFRAVNFANPEEIIIMIFSIFCLNKNNPS